jgi:hypothetical protein
MVFILAFYLAGLVPHSFVVLPLNAANICAVAQIIAQFKQV